LWLRGAEETVKQVRLVDWEYNAATMAPSYAIEWTHVLHSPSPIRPEVTSLLRLLERILTLPESDRMTGTFALDWYKIPPDDDHSAWRNTAAGDLVHCGKYWYKNDPDQQATCGRPLAEFACEVVRAHPRLMSTQVVLDVPGHDSRRVSFGSRLAHTVARDTAKKFVKVAARDEFRAQAKAMNATEHAESLRGQFQVREGLAGIDVLVVDDVFRSGTSMREVATAAKSAGARSVYGLVAARTMRGS
jgi:hypothetical protein